MRFFILLLFFKDALNTLFRQIKLFRKLRLGSAAAKRPVDFPIALLKRSAGVRGLSPGLAIFFLSGDVDAFTVHVILYLRKNFRRKYLFRPFIAHFALLKITLIPTSFSFQ